MELHDLLERLVAVLERLQIPYLITGPSRRWPMANHG
jgi:hypothetical protein